MAKLGVNIDHVATLRQARKTVEPDPVLAAGICEMAGAACITVHLREDRRHIQDNDVVLLRKGVRTKLNLEMADVDSIVRFALTVLPDQVTLVPEKRQEITTEGGLDVVKNLANLKRTVRALANSSIAVSLFVDPDAKQIDAAAETGAHYIELHTGAYANASRESEAQSELNILLAAAATATKLGLRVNAGHGIHYHNARDLLKIPKLEEVNIGHSIVSRALFTGLSQAVRDMVALLAG